MKTLYSYLLEHNLFDEQTLLEHCERHLVKVHHSEKFPNLRLLHYSEKAVYNKKWTEFCKACRGVVIDLKNRKILATPFFKFWNMTEAPGPSYAECQSFGPFTVSEKLDGSMAILFRDVDTGLVHATTKGSFDSTQGQDATNWAREHLPLSKLDVDKYTLMWEWIAYDNKVVVDYAQKGYKVGLYLIGVRENYSEKLFSYEEVQEFAKEYGLLTVKTYPFSNLDQVMDNCKDIPHQEEGYVLRFKCNGLLVKCKGTAYLKVHRFLSGLNDKNLLELMIDGQEKEVMDTCPEEYKEEVLGTLNNYRKQALDVQSQVYRLFAQSPKDNRKSLALWVKSTVPSELQRYIFHLADQKPLTLNMFYQAFLKDRRPAIGPTTIQVPSLVVLVGVSGSGKSTLGRRLFPKDSIVSSDYCRELICWNSNSPEGLSGTEYWAKMQSVSNQAFQMFHKDISNLLSKGQLAVADATNLSPRARTALKFIADQHKVPITYIVNCVPENLCVQRDAARKYPVGAQVVAKQVVQMEQVVKDLSGKDNVIFITPKTSDQLSVNLVSSNGDIVITEKEPKMENTKKDTILCDLDGTLANLDHRLHFIKDKKYANWDSFFATCSQDTPNPWCVELLKAMKSRGFKVLIVSARSRVVLQESREWLDNVGLDFAEMVLVRPEKDSTPDQVLKKKWLDSFGKERILFVVDDRDKVCKMWVAQGLQVLNCGQGKVF